MSDTTLSIKLLLDDKDALAKLNGALKQIGDNSKSSTDSMNLGWAGFASQLFIVEKAIGPVIELMKSAVIEAQKDEEAFHRLSIALQNQGFTTDALSKKYEDLADSLSRSTRFSKSSLEETITTLINLGNVGPSQMDKITRATLNLATVTGRDLPQAALIMAKAAEGNLTALKKWGIELDENKTKSEQYDQLLEILSTRFGSAATEDVKNFSGAQAQLGNAIHEVLAELGNFVIKSPGVQAAMAGMTKGALDLAESLKKLSAESESDRSKKFMEANKQNPDIARFLQQQNASAIASGGEAQNNMARPSSEEAFLRNLVNARAEVAAQMEADQVLHNQRMDEIDRLFNDSKLNQLISSSETAKLIKEKETQDYLEKEQKKIDAFLKAADLDKATQAKLLQYKKAISEAELENHQKTQEAVLKAELQKFKLQFQLASAVANLSQELSIATGSSALKGISVVLNASVAAAKAIIAIKAAVNPLARITAAIELAAVIVSAANAFSQINAAEKALNESKNKELELPNIPGLAGGGSVTRSGAVLVGERGPELLNLPRGAVVSPNQNSSGNVYHIQIVINNPVFTPDDLADQVVRNIGPRLSQFIDVERERL